MRKSHLSLASRLGIAASAIAIGLPAFADQAQFHGLGVLPGGTFSYVYGLSPDGSTVVGSASDGTGGAGGQAPFRWRLSEGLVNLGHLTPGSSERALAASFDGSVIIGDGQNASRAFRWNAASGLIDISTQIGTRLTSALALSHDGAVIVCASDAGTTAPRTTLLRQDGSLEQLPILPGGVGSYMFPSDVSADGAVVVGYGYWSTGTTSGTGAYVWSNSTGLRQLTTTAVATRASGLAATRVSSDGSTLIFTILGDPPHRLRGAHDESLLPLQITRPLAIAYDLSGDGSVVVGETDGHACLWRTNGQVVDIQESLLAAGIPIQGWTLWSAIAVSDDGRTIAGNGRSPAGRTEGWVAILPPPCATDFDADGHLNVADIFAFLDSWFAGDPRADFNSVNGINVTDIFSFLDAWFIGCA